MSEFLEDSDGSMSATRLGFLLWVIGVLAVWVADSIAQRSLLGVPGEVTTIIGILMTGKVVQKFGETSQDDQPAAASPAADAVGGQTRPGLLGPGRSQAERNEVDARGWAGPPG